MTSSVHSGGAAEHPVACGTVPQQKAIWLRMAVAPRLWDLALNKEEYVSKLECS